MSDSPAEKNPDQESPDQESSDQQSQEEPKIVIDSDWKEQVAKEKEAAAQGESGESTADDVEPSGTAAATESEPAVKTQDGDSGAGQGDAAQQLPPASIESLVSMLFSQTMFALGQFPDPNGGEPMVNKPYAKHCIDLLDVLTEKTKGNLKDEESKVLSQTLHALRMAYVDTKTS